MAAAIRRKVMKTKFDVSAIVLANSMADFGTSALLICLSLEERTKKLEELFLLAASESNDEAALRYYKLLQQSFLDIEAAPRIEEMDGVTVYTHDEKEVMRSRANSACALKTMELYSQIAGFKVLPNGDFVRDEKFGIPKEAELLNTKKAMLEYVASRWHKSLDVEESEACLMFLFTAYEFSQHFKEDEMIEKMLRDATPEYFPVKRLARGIGLLSEKEKYESIRHKVKKFREILGCAWFRNSDTRLVGNVFNASWPIIETFRDIDRSGASQAFELSRRYSEDIVRMEAAIEDLVKSMRSSPDLMCQVPGEIRAVCKSLNQVEVAVEVGSIFRSFHGRVYDRREADRWFELARDCITRWLERPIECAVYLALVVKRQSTGEKIYFRDQNLGE